MAKAVPIVAAVAGFALGGPLALGLGFASTGLAANIAGFVVSTAVGQLGGRALGKKPKAQAFTQEAQGRAVVLRSSVETHKIIYGRARVSGPLAFAATVDSGVAGDGVWRTGTNIFLHLVIPLAGHEIDAVETVYINDRPVTLNADGYVTDAPYNLNGYFHARVLAYTGSPDQAAGPVLLAEVPGWTPDHRLRGVPYLHVKLQFSNEVFPLGIPNVSAVVRGKRVYDPRTALTAWTDNAALCVRDYLTAECGVAPARFDDAFTTAAANVSDEAVAVSTGGTLARYTCNGVADTGVSRRDNLNALTASMAGEVLRVGGQIRIFAGAYDAPVGAITDDILAGDLMIRGRTPRSDLVNTVRGTYVDPGRKYQPTDFPPVTNATYVSQDSGQVYDKDLELPFTTHHESAQRIAKVVMEKARQGITVEATVMHHALQYACWDVVSVTQDLAGFADKAFRVKQFKMASAPAGAITLVLQEESAASYDWNSGEATAADDAPDTNLPNPLAVRPPGAPQVSEALYTTTDGSGVKAKAVVTWGASDDAFLRDYQLEYKLAAGAEYTIAGRTVATAAEVFDLAPGAYLFRVRAFNTLGVPSPYSPVSAQSLFGLTAAPGAVQNLSLNAIGGAAHLSWDRAADLDVVNGGSVRLRFTPELTAPAWNAAVDIGPAVSGAATGAVLPLLAGTYLAKFVDSTGNASATEATVTTTVVNLLELNVVATIEEHPTFAGAKDHIAYDEALGGIKLAGQTDWDDYPGTVDTWPTVDGLGGVAPAGVYDFFHSVDLGAVYTSRVTADLAVSGYDTGDLFDARFGNIDTWTSFDGGGVSSFTETPWSVGSSDAVVTADQAASPDGTVTADLLREGTVPSGEHRVSLDTDDVGLAIGGRNLTVEVYVKSAGRNLRLELSWVGRLIQINFNLATGAVHSTSVDPDVTLVDYGIGPAANGFYRVWVTGRSDDGFRELSDATLLLLNGTSKFYTGDGSSGVYLWGYKGYPGALQAVSANDDTNAALYLRTTDDDPSGTPTWGAWRQFFVGDYTARAFEFQLRTTSGNTNHNVLVTRLGVTIDMPDRVESAGNLASGAGAYAAAYASAFRETPALSVTPYDLATGDYYTIANEDEAGFEVTFRNSAGAAVSRRFDYTAKGYGKQV